MLAYTYIEKGKFVLAEKPKPMNSLSRSGMESSIQTTEAKGQSPYPSYGASIMKGDSYYGHQEDSQRVVKDAIRFMSNKSQVILK